MDRKFYTIMLLTPLYRSYQSPPSCPSLALAQQIDTLDCFVEMLH